MATQVQLRRGTTAENDAFTGAQGELTFDTNNKRVRVHDGGTAGGFEIVTEDASGNVGIGTNSPARQLEIYDDGTNGQAVLALTAQNTENSRIMFADTDDNNIGILDYNHSDDSMRFIVNNSEAARLDASGNFLVGTTSSINVGSGSDVGVMATNNGGLVAYRSNDIAAFFGRQSSGGDIVQFRESGTTVGSIGVENDDLTIGTGDTGLQFRDASDAIRPFNISTNAARDASIDLGRSSERFRNLYLSGGVYLGGTGSANLLDDYEEGTWTPELYKGTTQVTSPTVASGKYRKVGDLLYLNWYFIKNSGAFGSQTGNWIVKGFPFTLNTGAPYAGIPVTYFAINSVDYFEDSPHRVQANYSDGMEVYGAQTNTDWTSGYVEVAANGVIRLS